MAADITALLVPNLEAAGMIQPAESPCDYPAPFAQPLKGFDAALGNPHRDAALMQPVAVVSLIVAFIAM